MGNHGVLVVGPTVAQALDELCYLEKAAELQVAGAVHRQAAGAGAGRCGPAGLRASGTITPPVFQRCICRR